MGCRHNAVGRGGALVNWVEVEGRQLLVVGGERGEGAVTAQLHIIPRLGRGRNKS